MICPSVFSDQVLILLRTIVLIVRNYGQKLDTSEQGGIISRALSGASVAEVSPEGEIAQAS
jgi:hypothetical protein